MEKCGFYMSFLRENYSLDQVLLHWCIAHRFQWQKVLSVFMCLIPHTESS